MTVAWGTIEAALGDNRTAPEIIAALTASSAGEVEEMFDRIGAGDAGRLLREAQAADPDERRAKLSDCLAALDDAVATGGQPVKGLWPAWSADGGTTLRAMATWRSPRSSRA